MSEKDKRALLEVIYEKVVFIWSHINQVRLFGWDRYHVVLNEQKKRFIGSFGFILCLRIVKLKGSFDYKRRFSISTNLDEKLRHFHFIHFLLLIFFRSWTIFCLCVFVA